MTLFYANKTRGAFTSQQLTTLVYHELAHTQHYNQVGNDFWTAYIAHIVESFFTNGTTYGFKSDFGSGRIAISEGWGNYVGQLFQINRFQQAGVTQRVNDALAQLENQIPSDVGDGWFVYGMYHDMTDPGEPPFTGVRDNVTTYTPATVFRGLQSDVTTVRGYQARVNAQNASVQAAQLNTLVTDYRW